MSSIRVTWHKHVVRLPVLLGNYAVCNVNVCRSEGKVVMDGWKQKYYMYFAYLHILELLGLFPGLMICIYVFATLVSDKSWLLCISIQYQHAVQSRMQYIIGRLVDLQSHQMGVAKNYFVEKMCDCNYNTRNICSILLILGHSALGSRADKPSTLT